MLNFIKLLPFLNLALANYLVIKDFRTDQRVLFVDIVKISDNHCFGPIFNLQTQSLCGTKTHLSLTESSQSHQNIFNFLSDHQTHLDKLHSCSMVLVRNFSCSVKYQMENAKMMRFGSIIYATTSTKFVEQLTDFAEKESRLTMSVVIISEKDGEHLDRITKTKFCYAQLMQGELSFAIVMTYVFIVGVATFVIFCILKMTRLFHKLWERFSHFIKIKILLSKLELQKFQPGCGDDCCPICLIEFTANEKIKMLRCSHGFHEKCIDHWIRHHKRTCPLCNKEVFIPNFRYPVQCPACVPEIGSHHIQPDEESRETVITGDVEVRNDNTHESMNNQTNFVILERVRLPSSDIVELSSCVNKGQQSQLLQTITISNDTMKEESF